MTMKFTMYSIGFSVAIFLALFELTTARAATSYKVHFLSISFSMVCDSGTPKSNRKLYPRASGADLGVNEYECADTRRQVVKLKPTEIGVEHDEHFDKFEIVIHLNASDAKALSDITKGVGINGASKRILVCVDGRVISSRYLYEPFSGNDFYMSAESRDDAHKLARLFVDKITQEPLAPGNH